MFERKDSYYIRAKKEGKRSRAYYKIEEINKKQKIINKGDTILEAGASPGGWSQAIIDIIGTSGFLLGVDILDMEHFKQDNFAFIKGDINNKHVLDKIKSIRQTFDCIVSDVAPNTTGVKFSDHYNSYNIVYQIFVSASSILKQGGHYLFKMFDGEETYGLLKELKSYFRNVKIVKPDSSRKSSFEIYICCKNKI